MTARTTEMGVDGGMRPLPIAMAHDVGELARFGDFTFESSTPNRRLRGMWWRNFIKSFDKRPSPLADEARAQPSDRDDDPSAQHQLGLKSVADGDPARAEHAFRRVIERHPGFAEAHHSLGRLLERRNDDAGAERHYRAAVTATPTYAEAHHSLGRLLERRNDDAGAEHHYRAAVTATPTYAEAHHSLGRLLERRNDDAGAERHYRAAVTATPTYAEAWFSLGKRLEARQETLQALDAYKEAACRQSDYMAVWRAAIPLAARTGQHQHSLVAPLFASLARYAATLEATGEERVAVWYFIRMERLGHLLTDPRYFRHAFGGRFDRLAVLSRPRRHAANPVLFDISLRGLALIEVEDDFLNHLSMVGIEPFTIGNITYVLSSMDSWAQSYNDAVTHGQLVFEPLMLNETSQAQGDKLASQLGVAENARIVTIHMRQRGFIEKVALQGILGSQSEDHHEFRNVRIETFLPAISYLRDQGYVVVRIGDMSMTPLPDLGTNVIDLPFTSVYDPVLDPYFVSRGEFMVGTNSGVMALAVMFGRPLLVIDSPYNAFDFMVYHSPVVYSFKKLFRELPHNERDYLSFRQILERRIDLLSYQHEFDTQKLIHEDMSSGDIIAACQEIIEIVSEKSSEESQYQHRFLDICRKNRPNDLYKIGERTELVMPECPGFRVSASFCRLNSFFLD